jgi:hypothetical protein
LVQGVVGFNGLGQRSELRVLGLFDSALQLNVAGYNGLANPHTGPLRGLSILLQFTDNMDQSCLQAESFVSWRCIFSEYQFKYLTHPFIFIADQYDSQTLNELMAREPVDVTLDYESLDDDQKTYANNFATEVRTYFDN